MLSCALFIIDSVFELYYFLTFKNSRLLYSSAFSVTFENYYCFLSILTDVVFAQL